MNLDDLIAIDVHVHLEHDAGSTDADAAARKYFGPSVAATGAAALSEYYRSRKMGFVVFTVDERLTGRPHLTNEAILEFAAANADIAISHQLDEADQYPSEENLRHAPAFQGEQ